MPQLSNCFVRVSGRRSILQKLVWPALLKYEVTQESQCVSVVTDRIRDLLTVSVVHNLSVTGLVY